MNILLLIHPNFAIENWDNVKTAPKLKSYYDDVIRYVSNFDGVVIVHLKKPYTSRGQVNNSEVNWEYYDEFMSALESLESDKVVLTWDESDLGSTFGNVLDELLLADPPEKIFLAGGYYGDCLRRTYNELMRQYGTYFDDVGTKIHKVSSLIFVPGGKAHRLSDSDIDKYQRSYVDVQAGRAGWPSGAHWHGMSKGEDLPESRKSDITDIANIISEDIHVFKSPEILMTFNQDLRRRSKLTDRIDKALNEGQSVTL